MTFDELMQQYVDAPYEVLVEKANRDVDLIEADLDGCGVSVDDVVIPVVLTCFGTDGEFTDREYNFLHDVIADLTYEQAKDCVQAFYNEQEESENDVDELVDGLTDDMKAVFLDLVCCVLAVDGKLSAPEVNFIKKLIV